MSKTRNIGDMLEQLAQYIEIEDGELNEIDFLELVSDRIDEDLTTFYAQSKRLP